MITNDGLRIKGKVASFVNSQLCLAHAFNRRVLYRVTYGNVIPLQVCINSDHLFCFSYPIPQGNISLIENHTYCALLNQNNHFDFVIG